MHIGRTTATRRLGSLALALTLGVGGLSATGVLLSSAGAQSPFPSCNDTWTGPATGGSWETTADWSAGTPGTSSDACIPANDVVTYPNVTSTVDSVHVEASGGLLVGTTSSGFATLTATNGVLDDGSLTLVDGATLSGVSLTVSNGATFDVPAEPSPVQLDTTTATVSGAATIEGSLTVGTGDSVDNDGSMSLASTGVLTVGSSGHTATFVQDGTLTLAAGASLTDTGTFEVSGGTICTATATQVGIEPGTLDFDSGVTATGSCGTGQLHDDLAVPNYGTQGAADVTWNGTIPSGYTVTVGSTAAGYGTLTAGSSVTNDGTIALIDGATLGAGTGDTVTNAGTIDVPSEQIASVLSGLTLDSTGSLTVEGSLNIVGGTYTNDGSVSLASTSVVTVGSSTKPATFVQDGTLTLVAGASLTDTGTFEVSGGTICTATATQVGIEPGTLDFDAGVAATGSCGTGQLRDELAIVNYGVQGAADVTWNGTIPSGYTVTVGSTAAGFGTLTAGSSVTNDGTIALIDGATLGAGSGDTVTNAGTIDVPTAQYASVLSGLTFGSSGSLTVEGSLNVVGGTYTNDGSMSLASTGVLTVGSSGHTATFVQDGTLTLAAGASLTDTGTFEVSGGTICTATATQVGIEPGTLDFDSGVTATGSCGTGQLHDDLAVPNYGTQGAADVTWNGTIPSGYTVTVGSTAAGYGTLTAGSSVTNDGTIALIDGATLGAGTGDTVTNAGTIDVPSEQIASVLSGLTLDSTGSLTVEGSLNIVGGTYTNDGDITIDPTSTVAVSGTGTAPRLVNQSDGTLTFELASATSFGKISAQAPISLGGTAVPLAVSGYVPAPLSEYLVIQASGSGSYAGSFATVTNGFSGDYTSTAHVGLVAGKEPTSTGLAGPGGSLQLGQSASFTATVSNGTSTPPTGTVTFTLQGNPTPLGTAPLSAGQATFATTMLPLGTSQVVASYGGDTLNSSGASAPFPVTVDAAQTSTSLVVAPSGSLYGASVGLTATVTGTGSPTGTVTFTDTSTNATLGTGTLSGGSASLSVSTLAVGLHAITAMYNGDTNNASSTSTAQTASVTPAAVTATLVPSPSPASFGAPVTLTASLSSTITPTSGTVTFSDTSTTPATVLGTAPVNDTGAADLSVSTLAVGAHAIVATLGATANYQGTTSNVAPETITQASTNTGLSTGPNPSAPGQTVTLTATVSSPGGTPGGTVTFTDNTTTPAVTLGTGTLIPNMDGTASATLTLSTLAVGSHTLEASYGATTDFVGSSSSGVGQTVSANGTSTGLSLTSPVVYGSNVALAATVSNTTSTPPTGTVVFTDTTNNQVLGSATLTAGVATLDLTTLGGGSHAITAAYQGDGTNATSTSTAQTVTVTPAPVTIVLSAGPNPATTGQSVAFTATLGSTITPTSGTVTFSDASTTPATVIGTAPVGAGGVATLNLSTLAAGIHPVTASVATTTNYQSDTSNAVSETVQTAQGGTSTALTSSQNPSTVGAPPTFTATITGGSAPATGAVTFKDGSTVLGTVTAVNGRATFTASALASAYAIGNHTITASYARDTTHLASGSGPLTQTVASPLFVDSGEGTSLDIFNSATNALGASFRVGSNACGCNAQDYLAVSKDGTRAYVLDPNSSGSVVQVVNTANGAVLTSISISGWGVDLTLSPSGADLFVADSAPADAVTIISTATDQVIGTIGGFGTASFPQALAVNPAGTELFVVLNNTSVDVVNLSTDRVVAVIPLRGAEGIAAASNGTAVYVTNGFNGAAQDAGTVSVINTGTNTITRTYSGMTEPVAVAVSPDGGHLYVANVGTYVVGNVGHTGTPYLGVVNLSTGTVSDIDLPNIPNGVAVSTDGTKVYAAVNGLQSGGDLVVINASTSATLATEPGSEFDTIVPFGAAPPVPQVTPLEVATTTLPAAVKGQFYKTTLSASGGLAPYAWTATAPLPAGLTLAANSGVISGIPTATGSFPISVAVSDSDYPSGTAQATLSLSVAAGSTAPPPCGGATGSAPGIGTPTACDTASSSSPTGIATATSTSPQGNVTVTAHGSGGLTVGQYGTIPSGVGFRTTGSGFDVALSSINTFTSVTIQDCALGGATSFLWFNPSANGGAGGWQTATPSTYTPARLFTPACVTLTLSALSSPTLSQLTSTSFAGVLPAESVSVSIGGPAPYSISGPVLSGAISITTGLIDQITGTAVVAGSKGQSVTVTFKESCVIAICGGSFSVADPDAGVNTTINASLGLARISATEASGQGLAVGSSGPPFPVSWDVTVASPTGR